MSIKERVNMEDDHNLRQPSGISRNWSELHVSAFFSKTALIIKKLLCKAPEFRSASELGIIEEMLIKIKFFKDLRSQTDPATLRECATWVQLESHRQGEVRLSQFIFKQGDRGVLFYIIITGSVTINDERIGDDGEVLLVPLAHYSSGQSFGELALLQDRPRSGSAVCDIDCDFAIFSKAIYKKVIGKLEDRRLNARIDFLGKLPIFANWTRNSLGKLSYYFIELQFPRKKVVFDEGGLPVYVYVVFSGEFSLYTRVGVMPKGREISVRNKNRKLSVAVALLGQGEFICHENAIKNTSLTYSCKCSSAEGTLWAIESPEFLRKVAFVENLQRVNIIVASREAGHIKRAMDFEALKLEKLTPKTERHKSPTSPGLQIYRPFTRGASTSRLRRQNLMQMQKTLSKLEGGKLQLMNTDDGQLEPRREERTPVKRTMSNLKSRPEPGLTLKRSLNRTKSMSHRKMKTIVTNMHVHTMRQGLEHELRMKAYSPFIFKDDAPYADPNAK